MNNFRTIKAILIAPWASIIVVIVLFVDYLFHKDIESLTTMTSQMLGVFLIFVMFIFGFVGASYFLVLFFILPIHLLLTRYNITHWLVYVGFGVVIALICDYYFVVSDSGMPVQLQKIGYYVSGSSAIFVSLTFWYVGVRQN
jgi:hypothetical protein